MKCVNKLFIVALSTFFTGSIFAGTEAKPATKYTIEANQNVLKSLPFNDKEDFKNAQRGFIAVPDQVTITDTDGKVVWDLEEYKKFITLEATAPDSVNPSLWRNAQLVMQHGLFEVTKNIYQVRSFDLSNITFIKGQTGWIVFDPLISPETAKAALDLINQEIGERPVVGIIYSHSHIDHYGGATGLVSKADVDAGKVQILAPEHFTEHAVSENVIAGNAMGRRAVYMYGAMLPRNARGGVNGGLGMTTSTGSAGLLLPTHEVKKTDEVITIDGVKMVFQMTPGTEAPAEMNTWFPQWQALWMAENTTNTMHNILTLRGAVVRDALKWSSYLNETIEKWGGQAKVKFQSHHWPVWGNDNIKPYFEKQRDIYKFTHDQSVRLMNQGYNGEEISEMITLPESLENNWATRGYYGTLRHNSRAVYQRYMGWYNGNPSDLNNLPPEMVAKKYMDFMGGEQQVLEKAQKSFEQGEYRWVAEVMKHAVFANPDSKASKELLADAYEQLGYQAESGPWRSVYLQGALELRNGVTKLAVTSTATPDTIRAMSPSMLFDYFAIRLNPEKAAGRDFTINIDFTDLKSKHTLIVKNSVLNHTANQHKRFDAALTMTMATMNEIQLQEFTLAEALDSGKIKIIGNKKLVTDFFSMLDNFDFWFNVVTP